MSGALLPLSSETVLRPLLVNPLPEGLVVGVALGDQAVPVLGLVYVKLVVAVVPGVVLGAPFEAQILKQLDPFLGEVAVLPLVSETVLRPLGVNPLPEGLVLGVVRVGPGSSRACSCIRQARRSGRSRLAPAAYWLSSF